MNFQYLVLAILACRILLADQASSNRSRHFVFFDRDHERVHEKSFLETTAFEGAELKFTWRELEPKKGQYDFSGVQAALDFLNKNGKKLFVQIQDSSFDAKIINVPEYLLREPEFHGGAEKQFETVEGNEDKAKPAGWVARRWDPTVQKRLRELFSALSEQFDGGLEGINLPETSVDFGETGKLFPKDFTPELYRDAVLTNMAAAKTVFRRSVVIQYANFMPGEWLPELDRGLLHSVFRGARDISYVFWCTQEPFYSEHLIPFLRAH